MNRFYEYIEQVESGKIVTGKLIKLAVSRFRSDMKKDWRWTFDEKKAEKVIRFFELCKHWKDRWAGKFIVLEPHQVFYLCQLFGWVDKETGLRRFNTSFKEVARKNAKTTESAIKSLYHLVIDNVTGAQVWCGSTREEQSRILTNDAGQIALITPILKDKFNTFKFNDQIKRLVYKKNNSFIAPLGADSRTQDGFSPTYGVVDEYHEHKTDAILNIIESGMGAAEQPMIDVITTAGFHKEYPCYTNLRKSAIEILKGIKKDDRFLAMIFEMDEEDDWEDEKNWIKANPNLNVSVGIEHLRSRYTKAKNEGGSKEVDFKTKNLNYWTDTVSTWIPDDVWMGCNLYERDLENYRGHDAILAFDLASHIDTNAITVLIPVEERFEVFTYVFIPEDTLQKRMEKGEHALYFEWVKDGYIVTTPGNVSDHEYLRKKIQEITEIVNVKKIAYDSWQALDIVVRLTEDNFNLVPYSQQLKHLSPPMKMLQKLILEKRINHSGNPVLRWMASNVMVYTDPNENIRPDKKKSSGRIDAIMSLIMALGVHLNSLLDEDQDYYINNELRTI